MNEIHKGHRVAATAPGRKHKDLGRPGAFAR